MTLKIGESAEFKKTVTESDIYRFAEITGDFNSVHIDAEEAKNSVFGERIAHGLLVAGYISTVLGMHLPGKGTIYLGQNLHFKAPVKIGDTITAKASVSRIISEEKGIYQLETICLNQNGNVVIDGEATVKYQDPAPRKTSSKEAPGKPQNASTFYEERELSGLGLKHYGKDVRISRNAVLYNPEQLEIGDHVRIDDYTTISGKVVLGDYIHIAQFCGLYGGTEGIFMEDFSGLSSRVVIYATSNDYSGNSLTNPTVPAKYKATDKNSTVRIGKHVVIGTTSVVLPGVSIGEGSSVGAMSLCGKSLEPWGIYAGAPAKKIKERSKKLLELEKQLREEES